MIIPEDVEKKLRMIAFEVGVTPENFLRTLITQESNRRFEGHDLEMVVRFQAAWNNQKEGINYLIRSVT